MMNKKITNGIFDAAKLLLENGASNMEVAKYLKISVDVVTMFRKAETYEEYQAIMYARCKQIKAAKMKAKEKLNKTEKNDDPKPEQQVQVVEHKQTVTVQATWQMMQEMQKTNKLLEGISNKLAFIVDELCGTKGGKEVG